MAKQVFVRCEWACKISSRMMIEIYRLFHYVQLWLFLPIYIPRCWIQRPIIMWTGALEIMGVKFASSCATLRDWSFEVCWLLLELNSRGEMFDWCDNERLTVSHWVYKKSCFPTLLLLAIAVVRIFFSRVFFLPFISFSYHFKVNRKPATIYTIKQQQITQPFEHCKLLLLNIRAFTR